MNATRRLLMIACMLGGSAVARAADVTYMFDDEQSLEGWSFHNGPEFPGARGGLTWDADHGRGGSGSLALAYDFTGGGNYVQAVCALPERNVARAVRLWLSKPGRHRITFRALDAAGQAFQKHVLYTFDDWQQIEVDLGRWEHFWGGPGDGKVRWPVRSFGIIIENNGDSLRGTLRIDDVTLLDAAGRQRAAASWYVASDFTEPGQWHARGGPGQRLDGGAWSYAFSEGHGPPVLGAKFSLLGRPTRLRLVLGSDGSGHAVRVVIGSHFQHFERRIGRLTNRGRQVLEVPLGDMATWQHYDGQNDGVPRYPLRIVQIRLDRGGDAAPAAGTIALERLGVETRLDDEPPVIIVPAVEHNGDDGPVEFSARLRSLRSEPVTGRLACDIRSLGRRLRREVVDLTLPGGADITGGTFTEAIGDRHMLEAVFQWQEPGLLTPPVSIGASTLPDDCGSPALAPDSAIGVGLYLYRWHDHARPREPMTRLAALARRAGVKWTREEFNWEIIEPERGRFQWAFYDELVSVALEQGISIYGLLCYWAPHASADTPEGIEQYCGFVRRVVNRYKDRIHHWEIWNEPNIFFWSGPREMYADLLTRAYETIKAKDPEAVVMGCSTSGIDTDFIKLTMDRGGRFDALTIHPYRGVLDDRAYMRELREVQPLVGGRPVWITEIGFPSQLLTGYSERRQASLIARVYLGALATEVVSSVSWYDFRNDGVDPFYHEFNFGTVRQDFSPKPGYRALATVGRTLGGMRVAGPVDIGPDAYAFRFTDGRREVIAACAPDAGRVLPFVTDADVMIRNAMGERVAPVHRGQRSSVTLDTGMPVYVSAEAGFAFEPAEPAVRLTASRTSVRPGQPIELVITPRADVAAWDLPFGWSDPVPGAPGGYRLTVPADASACDLDLQVVVRVDGGVLRLPLRLAIQPAVIRL